MQHLARLASAQVQIRVRQEHEDGHPSISIVSVWRMEMMVTARGTRRPQTQMPHALTTTLLQLLCGLGKQSIRAQQQNMILATAVKMSKAQTQLVQRPRQLWRSSRSVKKSSAHKFSWHPQCTCRQGRWFNANTCGCSLLRPLHSRHASNRSRHQARETVEAMAKPAAEEEVKEKGIGKQRGSTVVPAAVSQELQLPLL